MPRDSYIVNFPHHITSPSPSQILYLYKTEHHGQTLGEYIQHLNKSLDEYTKTFNEASQSALGLLPTDFISVFDNLTSGRKLADSIQDAVAVSGGHGYTISRSESNVTIYGNQNADIFMSKLQEHWPVNYTLKFDQVKKYFVYIQKEKTEIIDE